jgi:hypothetical protein
MDKEMLEALSNLLDKKLEENLRPIHADIKKIISKIDEVESVNATRHTDMMNNIIDIKKDLNDIKIVTSQNCFDFVKLNVLKSVK